VTLGGSGTAATLAFGSVSAYGTDPAHVTKTVQGTTFTVATPVGVTVSKANLTSSNYTLKAQLGRGEGGSHRRGANL
jgi:hypothetical protein